MTAITLAQADRLIDAILARGAELDCRPLSVIVVEPGCKVKAFKKEDGSSMIRFEMAYGKAYAALAMGRSSKLVKLRAKEKPMFMRYLIAASGEQIFPEGGGLQIRDASGEVIGAVGSPATPRIATRSWRPTAFVRSASKPTRTARPWAAAAGSGLQTDENDRSYSGARNRRPSHAHDGRAGRWWARNTMLLRPCSRASEAAAGSAHRSNALCASHSLAGSSVSRNCTSPAASSAIGRPSR
jgi:uncharacterized protein GlcG (DUF336 family)